MPDKFTLEIRQKILENTARLLIENYAFPDIAEKMAAHIYEKLREGCYDDCDKPSKFGARLTEDLREISNDLHLIVYYYPEEAAALAHHEAQNPSGDDYESHWWTLVHSDNFGIPKVEYLAGNVGYIDVRFFAPVNLAGQTAVAAMNFLSQCDALIFDLRQCGGGDPFMVQLFESYFFSENKEPILLLSKYCPSKDRLQQRWTFPYVPGERLPDLPVYILTSQRTFSGGEDMAYTLKHHRRACIVGETTGGGAHPVAQMAICEGFVINLPNETPVHPVTQGNWEGIGVRPDIAVPREQALQTAHIHALKTLIENAETPDCAHALEWYLQRVRATYQPPDFEVSSLDRYVGEYRGYEVKIKAGCPVLTRKNREDNWKMIPIAEHTFTADEDYNARFEIGEDGQATAFVWLGRDNHQEIIYARTVHP